MSLLHRTPGVLAVIALATLAAVAAQEIDGHWKGRIDVPGRPLEIEVDLETADGTLTGDISIPVQGLRDFGLVDLVLEGSTIRFRIPNIPGDPSFDGTLSDDGESIAGTFSQAGQELTFELSRGAPPADAARAALDGIDGVVLQALEDFNVPGLALAVVSGGEVVYAEGFGKRDVEGDLPMTPDTLFAIGSTTKAMTATLLGMLVDEGKLEWDAPLRTYLPRFRLADPMTTERITPRDLVTHRSGLPRHDLLWYNDNDSSREEVVARLAHLELTHDLRARFQYNNLLFMTAGYLAGRLTDSTWEEQVRRRLFEPLGMRRSNFSVADSQQDPDHAEPYRENEDDELERIPFRPIQMMGPAGSVNSTVNEMSRWLQLNLRGGKTADRQLINASTLAEIQSAQMATGQTPERPDVSPGSYGMGWGIDTYRGHRRVAHGGGIDGFVTSVMLFPDDDLGLVSFTNVGSGLPPLVNQTVADRVLGLESVDWIGEALALRVKGKQAVEEAQAKKEATRVTGTRPSHDLTAYAGAYEHPGYGPLGVEIAGEELELRYNGIVAPLEHWHYDVWNGAETDDDKTFEHLKFQFRANVDGLIASVESRLEPTAEPIVFEKRPDARLYDPEFLERLTGAYTSDTGGRLRVERSGDTLTLNIPGQPRLTLEPDLSGRFVVAEVRLVSIAFEVADGRATGAKLYQPGAVFEWKRVED